MPRPTASGTSSFSCRRSRWPRSFGSSMPTPNTTRRHQASRAAIGSCHDRFQSGRRASGRAPSRYPHGLRAGTGFYTGLSSTHAVTETDRLTDRRAGDAHPFGARRLLGFPLDEVGDRLIDPNDLFGAASRRVVERLGEAPRTPHVSRCWRKRFQVGKPPGQPAPATSSGRRNRSSAEPARLSITELASTLGCSRKHLTTRFRREFGIGPKLLARVIRFDNAVRLIRRRQDLSLAHLAAACGYADQAHLTREVRQFAGSPPGELLGRVLPDQGGWTD